MIQLIAHELLWLFTIHPISGFKDFVPRGNLWATQIIPNSSFAEHNLCVQCI